MFRRLETSLPPDPHFPADLNKLGYFVTENDQIKKIADPSEGFLYKISNNDRVNEMQKEALNECVRSIVKTRLTSPPISLKSVLLPLGATQNTPHVPILISRDLHIRKHVIIVIGEFYQDLGIWAYRQAGNVGINTGSAVAFAKAVYDSRWTNPDSKDMAETPGIILLNPGQLAYHRRTCTPMTILSWQCIPRKTAVESGPLISEANRPPQNKTAFEHLTYVTAAILSDPTFVSPSAKLYLIGICDGGANIVKYLASNWTPIWDTRIAALALTDPQHMASHLPQPLSEGFKEFLSSKTRAYVLSEEPRDTPVTGREKFGCNCYASGERFHGESVLCEAWGSVLAWFKLVAGLGDMCQEVPQEESVAEGGTDEAIAGKAGENGLDGGRAGID